MFEKVEMYFIVIVGLFLIAQNAYAYLGPGAGLGMIGSLIALIVAGIVIVLGIIIYPIRMLRKRKAKSLKNDAVTPNSK